MFYYLLQNKFLISAEEYDKLQRVSEKEVKECSEIIYALARINPLKSRRSFCASDPSLLFLKEEGIKLIQKAPKRNNNLPGWLVHKIKKKRVCMLNTAYPEWQKVLTDQFPWNQPWKINIVGLGDVGGNILTGLRLLGGKWIKDIGIYDKNEKLVRRWEMEANQIIGPNGRKIFPLVHIVKEDELFDGDLFLFCATMGVPPISTEKKDVRMEQWEGNAQIILEFAKKARKSSFKGIFAVVSDPVDLLCKTAFLASNRDREGRLDFKGLAPEQIRGYGLGVMYARASYYAQKISETISYNKEGRAFGPHGQGLVIANSIKNYNQDLSEMLTEKALEANLSIRELGYKPYIAPAFSSAVLPILATIQGKWHYSATFLGGVYMGLRNRLHPAGIELERLNLPTLLMERIKNSYLSLSKANAFINVF